MKVSALGIGVLLLAAMPVALVGQTAVPRPGPSAASPNAAGKSIAIPCQVKVIEEVQVPAEEAGVLRKLMAKEGDEVTKDQVLGQIDDVMAQKQLEVAKNEMAVAKEQAESEVGVRYAQAAWAVAWAEYQAALEANRKVPGTFPEIEVKKLELTSNRAGWELEKAKMDRRIALLQYNVSKAKWDASETALQYRKIKSPLDAVVEELYRHEGEAVQQYEPVLRLIRADRLWIEGFVKASEHNRVEINGRPVTVRVKVGGESEDVTLEGTVVFTGLEIQYLGREEEGEFRVVGEVQNSKHKGRWLLQPGMQADMVIHLQ